MMRSPNCITRTASRLRARGICLAFPLINLMLLHKSTILLVTNLLNTVWKQQESTHHSRPWLSIILIRNKVSHPNVSYINFSGGPQHPHFTSPPKDNQHSHHGQHGAPPPAASCITSRVPTHRLRWPKWLQHSALPSAAEHFIHHGRPTGSASTQDVQQELPNQDSKPRQVGGTISRL